MPRKDERFVPNNPAAFPRAGFFQSGAFEDGYCNGPEDGMTLRDHFAGQALIGAVGSPSFEALSFDELAAWVYGVADAMLKAR